MDGLRPWRQVNIAFHDWPTAERIAVAHLAPLLTAAETEGLITAWFFVRKTPCWRVRYLPADKTSSLEDHLHLRIENLKREGHVADLTAVVYEPEARAFGGVQGMGSAHRLFHLDSRHLLTHLVTTGHLPGPGHRRELSVLLCTDLMRAAGLDWYEQGDVWARVARHRESLEPLPQGQGRALQAKMKTLMSADTTNLTGNGSPLGLSIPWARAFTRAGRELADLTAHGLLHRGLRAVLAHHIVFAWNRFGMPYATQAALADAAQATVFGPESTDRSPTIGDWA